MSGFIIGLGVGLRYSTPNTREINIVIPPPIEIKDAIISENESIILLENGYYLKMESITKSKK